MNCLATYPLAALLLSTLNCDVVWAQTGSATQISGMATDQGDGVLPGVEITTTPTTTLSI